MTSLTDRAALALRRARATDPDIDLRPADPHRAAHRHHLTRHTATTLGLDPADITVTDDPDRSYGPWRGFLIMLTDNHARSAPWAFITRVGTDQLLLLGPCPGCPGLVPLAEIGDLTDLGRHLETHTHPHTPTPPHPPGFTTDPGHHNNCPHHT